MIFQILKTIAAPSLSAVLCHSLDPAQTQGLVSMEAMLVMRHIPSTNRLVNSHTFGSSFIVLSLIWNFYVPSSLIFCQKALYYGVCMFYFSIALWTANRWKPYIRIPSFRKQHYKSLIMDKACFCLITLIICTFLKAWIAIDKYVKLQLGSSLALPQDKAELWDAWLRNMFLCKPFLWVVFFFFPQ